MLSFLVLPLYHQTTTNTKTMKLLIGGAALVQLGSDRRTEDTDYLVNVEGQPIFFFDRENNVDFVNAAANKFFAEIYKMESGNDTGIASPASLLELKAYSLVQHCLNFNWAKADAAEYDMKFLVRTFGLSMPTIVKKYVTAGEWSEIEKVIKSVR